MVEFSKKMKGVAEDTLNLTFNGNALVESPEDFGVLRSSTDARDDSGELRRRMVEDGYLYLPGFLNKDEVLEARREFMRRLMKAGVIDPAYPLMEGVARSGADLDSWPLGSFIRSLAANNPFLDQVIHEGPLIAFYENFLGGPVRYFDFTWMRVKLKGNNLATPPHCDIVFMSRGTQKLYTAWVPYGDVPYEMGGLMLLENSHKLEELKSGYGSTDVDLYCENEGNARAIVQRARAEDRDLTAEESASIRWNSKGAYSLDAVAVREELGGRWLTAEYEPGDLLVFCMNMIHASSDNRTNRLRISTDTRYQLASEPADHRWIGVDPPARGIRAKRGMIC